jgi:hypothetical protein
VINYFLTSNVAKVIQQELQEEESKIPYVLATLLAWLGIGHVFNMYVE